MSRRHDVLRAGLAAAAFVGLLAAGPLWRKFVSGKPAPAPAWAETPPFVPQSTYLGEEVLPPSPAPDFLLVSDEGMQVRLRDFRGRPLLLSFAYSGCTDICPALFIDFRDAASLLAPLGKAKPAFAFVTLDPDNDTPARLKEVRQAYQGPWTFLTGDLAALEKVWSGYGVVRRPGKGGRIDHSGLVLLIDAQGLIRVRYMGTPPGKVLAADAEKLVRGGS